MAAYELHEGSFSTDETGYVNYTRVFRVNTGNATLRPEWGVAGVAINRYDAYPSDSTALAYAASSVPVVGELGWFDVTYSYTNKPFDRGSGDSTGNSGSPGQNDPLSQADPTNRTPRVRFGQNQRMVPFIKDWDSPRKLVQNSAKQPFEGQEVEDITQTITVSFNRPATVNVSLKQSQYVNKVNDAGFAIVPQYGAYDAGTLRCNSWGGELQFEAGYGWYIACEVEFEYKPEGWQRVYIDMGMYERKHTGSGYERVKITNTATGQPVDAPVYLKAGARLPDGDAPVELTFYPYEWVSFTNVYA